MSSDELTNKHFEECAACSPEVVVLCAASRRCAMPRCRLTQSIALRGRWVCWPCMHRPLLLDCFFLQSIVLKIKRAAEISKMRKRVVEGRVSYYSSHFGVKNESTCEGVISKSTSCNVKIDSACDEIIRNLSTPDLKMRLRVMGG